MRKKLTDIYKFNRYEWEEIIYKWIFDEEHRKMLERFLLDGIRYEKLSEEFGCSRDKIAILIPKLIEELESKL